MISEIAIKLIKIKQKEIDNLEMIKKYYEGEDKKQKISERNVRSWYGGREDRIGA